MPQILKKSGVPNMVISRHEKGVFNWSGPDGSFVTAYSPGHYGEAYTSLQKNFFDAAEYIAESSMMWEKYYSAGSPETVVPLLSDWDMSPANDYSPIIRQWESISALKDENGVSTKISLPRFKIVTTPELFTSFVKAADPLPFISGERPALWLYIHGPSHQKAIKASREGDILLTMAEKFATIDALNENSFAAYPSERLYEAWEAKIFPDHGWGGNMGEITDDLFRRKYEFARREASQILESSTRSLASNVKTNLKKGIPVVVFNSLNWERTDMVHFQIGFNEGDAKSITMVDALGKVLPVQYQVEKEFGDGSIQLANVYFTAGKVPSIGYKTFYLKGSSAQGKSGTEPNPENNFYKIELGRGGLKSIYDKELKKELIDPAKFEAGEVFTMQSIGNGAGEFDKIQQPSMEGFAQSGNHPARWEPGESGDVFSTWTRRSKLPYAVVEQKVILHHGQKRIDFEISLLNWEGELYREFRMALPLKMEGGQVAYEVPFGVVEVGKDEMEGAAGERYHVPAKDLHPRGIENWIGASDDSFGVTLSSSVAVADYLDPTHDPLETLLLQPILLASRTSCHPLGNQYLQTGDHHFSFTLNSHLSGWINGYKTGRQANEALYAVVNPKPYAKASLAEERSFFSMEAEDIIISTIKKAEDDPSVIVRMFDLKGESRTINLHQDFSFSKASSTNLIEQAFDEIPLKKNQLSINVGHFAIETVKLK
jgi:alpha-mannosidase